MGREQVGPTADLADSPQNNIHSLHVTSDLACSANFPNNCQAEEALSGRNQKRAARRIASQIFENSRISMFRGFLALSPLDHGF
jgi:hypothetical protein